MPAHLSSTLDSTGLDLKGLNRYPDPHQHELKQLLCDLRQSQSPPQSQDANENLTPDNLFVGVGSDEAIDILIRCFCTPGKDKILICPPTYGMYTVSADVNDVEVVKVPQLAQKDGGFSIDIDTIVKTLDADIAASAQNPENGRIKLIFLCSPGNPTGQLVPKEIVESLLTHPKFNGLVLVDEAYIDFAPQGSSLAGSVNRYPNLAVMQTLSKAFGLAGIRLGVCFTSMEIAQVLNNVKAPYNISSITSQVACAALSASGLRVMEEHKASIIEQRDRLKRELRMIPGVGAFKGAMDSNFLLVEMLDATDSGGKPDNEVALRVYEALASRKGVVVRFRGKEHGCCGCLRITVGTEVEVGRFLEALRAVLGEIYGDGARGRVENGGSKIVEERRQVEESEVVA